MKSVEERLKGYQPLWENWRYTGEFLGKGGMSSVFEIEHNAYGSRDVCALKIIEVKTASDGRVRIPKDILNEIQIMRNLSDCPNIVRYYDDTTREVCDDDGNLVGVDILIRMEKLRSIDERTKLSEEEVIRLAKDICTALNYVEKKKIIHRDIKPHNIFVDETGQYKLGDFGISKIISEYAVKYTMEIGTQAYVAPEMYKGEAGEKYDVTTDIYSLGLVLYAFLNNNKLPFEDVESKMGVAIHRRLAGDAFNEPVHGRKKLKEIVMKACSYDSKNRYQSAEEMLKDIELLNKPKHKKYIIDPYMTIPANEDDEDEGIIYYDPVKGRGRDMFIKSGREKESERHGRLKMSGRIKSKDKKKLEETSISDSTVIESSGKSKLIISKSLAQTEEKEKHITYEGNKSTSSTNKMFRKSGKL